VDNSNSGCSQFGCETSVEEVTYTGSARLMVNGNEGYLGTGPGQYSAFESRDLVTSAACSNNASRATTGGPAELTVNAFFSIDNNVTGGPDTSAMSKDTSVVELLFEQHDLHQENYTKTGCDAPNTWSSNDASAGLACHFYGVDLRRPGYYTNLLHDDPMSGRCTLVLSR
jgi:hypothetical protein